MADDHFMPFYVGDFLGATATWPGDAQALYMLCLALEWSAGALPQHPEQLQLVLKYPPDAFARLWPLVSTKFIPSMLRHGELINERLEEIREENKAAQARKSADARAKANKRWGKPPRRDATADAGADAAAHATADAGGYAVAMQPNRTEPNRTEDTRSARIVAPHATASEAEPTPEQILAAYPHSANGSSIAALRAIDQLIGEGEASAAELMAATQRYAAFVAAGGASGPQFVKAPQRFYARTQPNAPAPWSLPWEPPKSKAEVQQDRNISAAQAWLQEQGHGRE